MKKKSSSKPVGYYVVAYDDIGRVVFKSQVHYITFDHAIRAAKNMINDRYIGRRVESYKVIRHTPRKNPETVATITATPVPPKANPTGKYKTPKPKENSIGAIFNRFGDKKWSYYHIRNGFAERITEREFHDSRKKFTVNAPVYVEE